jgi:putative aldouronate transport system permease protein
MSALRISPGEKVFSAINIIFLVAVTLLCLLPILNVVSQAFSGESAVIAGKVALLPVEPTFANIIYMMDDRLFLKGFLNSLIVTIVGTALSLLVTAVTAYPLSRVDLKGRKAFLILFVVSWLFNPGIIPSFLLIKQLGLLNRLAALFLPSMVVVFNMLVLKNFFEGIPDSLPEAAMVDGANNFTILFRVVLPISLPALAVNTLFYAVFYWNSFFAARLYITVPETKPLQLYLYEMVMETLNLAAIPSEDMHDVEEMSITPQGLRSAAVVISTIPILLVYPYLQRYFVKGLIVGSVKG